MTKYIYKGKEIDHSDFLTIMHMAGIQSGYRESHAQHLEKLASKGNKKAKEILSNLQIIED